MNALYYPFHLCHDLILARLLADYSIVIVPWGALHLPVIEYELLERGFRPIRSVEHRLLEWDTVQAALR